MIQKKFSTVILLLIAFFICSSIIAFIFSFSLNKLEIGNIAKIKIHGPIFVGKNVQGMFADSGTTADDLVGFIKKADKDPGIRAILLDINSPGGSAVASEQVAQAVSEANKTSIAVIREAGTSGAFWVASASDTIFASKASLTGSIGVIASYIEFSGLMSRYNVTYQRLVAGEMKDAGSPFRKLTDKEKDKFQEKLDELHELFISEVAENREMSQEEVRKVADGFFFTGAEAKEIGLVDELGTMQDAIRFIEKEKGIKADIIVYEKKVGLLDVLTGVTADIGYAIGKGIGSMFHTMPIIQ